jgi:fucose permease
VRESSFSALVKHAGATAAQGASVGFALGLLYVVANAAGLLAVEAASRMGMLASREPAANVVTAPVKAAPAKR